MDPPRVGRMAFQVGAGANQVITIDLADFGKKGPITGDITGDVDQAADQRPRHPGVDRRDEPDPQAGELGGEHRHGRVERRRGRLERVRGQRESVDHGIEQRRDVVGVAGARRLRGGDAVRPELRGHELRDRHVVQRGDTLKSIAKRYGITVMQIAWSNGLISTATPPAGRRLRIPDIAGVVHVVSEHETLKSISSRYRVKVDDVVAYNGLRSRDVVLGMVLVLPGGRGNALPTTQFYSSYAYGGTPPAAYRGITLRYPVPGGHYVRGFTSSHPALDIGARTASAKIDSVAEMRGAPILNPITGAEHRVRIDMDGGFEYKVAEVGRGWSKTSGPMQLDLADSYGHFCHLNLSQSGAFA